MADKREHSTHVRLSDEADAVADLMSEAGQTAKAELLSKLLERALLGEGHALSVAARRFVRLESIGIKRD